eukprot:1451678-Alexandrium_andersonii.AAC.1
MSASATGDMWSWLLTIGWKAIAPAQDGQSLPRLRVACGATARTTGHQPPRLRYSAEGPAR